MTSSKETQDNQEESIQTTISLVLAKPQLGKKAGMKKHDVCEDQLFLVL